jgi:hypothetical protein
VRYVSGRVPQPSLVTFLTPPADVQCVCVIGRPGVTPGVNLLRALSAANPSRTRPRQATQPPDRPGREGKAAAAESEHFAEADLAAPFL